jgi:hypothetical protein
MKRRWRRRCRYDPLPHGRRSVFRARGVGAGGSALMAAWGYIRFVCCRCGERFWCRMTDQFRVDGARALCHECDLLAIGAKTADTAVQQPHE